MEGLFQVPLGGDSFWRILFIKYVFFLNVSQSCVIIRVKEHNSYPNKSHNLEFYSIQPCPKLAEKHTDNMFCNSRVRINNIKHNGYIKHARHTYVWSAFLNHSQGSYLDFLAWISELCSNYILQSPQNNPLLPNDALVHGFGIESIHNILGKAEAKATSVLCMHQPRHLHPLAVKPEPKEKCNGHRAILSFHLQLGPAVTATILPVTHSDLCCYFICAVGFLLNPLRRINVMDHCCFSIWGLISSDSVLGLDVHCWINRAFMPTWQSLLIK